MSVLGRLFRHGEAQTGDAAQAGAGDVAVACPHMTLTARWDRVQDMGKEDLATAFHCESCGATLTGEEGRRLRH